MSTPGPGRPRICGKRCTSLPSSHEGWTIQPTAMPLPSDRVIPNLDYIPHPDISHAYTLDVLSLPQALRKESSTPPLPLDPLPDLISFRF